MATDLDTLCVSSWRTCNRVMQFLLENLPDELWSMKVPGTRYKTVRMLAGHVHNTRCMWIERLGAKHGVAVPARVDRRRVARPDLIPALEESSEALVRLLEAGLRTGGASTGGATAAPLPTSCTCCATSRHTRRITGARSSSWRGSSACASRRR